MKKCVRLLFAGTIILSSITTFAQNVGIGTPIPTEKLEVNGSVKITDGTQGNGKVLTSDANGKASWKQIIRKDTLSISPFAITSDGNNHNANTIRAFFPNAITGGRLVAPVNLPQGAIVTQITVYFFDNSLDNDYTIDFFNIVQGTPFGNSLATTYTTSGMNTNNQALGLNLPTPVIINNANNFYFISMTGNFLNSYDGLCGVRIAYTYPVNN